MTDTVNLGLPFIDGSQAQKHVTHNEALRILDAAVQIGVLDRTLTTPPVSPVDGERHLVASGATGAWAGQANNVAVREDGAWRFLVPKAGWCLWSAADNGLYVFNGTAWNAVGGGSSSLDNAAHVGINSTASSPNLLSVRSNASLFNSINTADGGSGDARVQISKESSAKTASVVFSDAFSGRAEFGLIGSDAFKLKVSNDGSTFVEAFNIDQTSGNLALPRGVSLTGVISPAQITSNQSDYNPAGIDSASVLQISTDASRTVSGLAGGTEGRVISVLNVGSQTVTLLDQSVSSTAANRFTLGGDLALGAKQAAILRYDGTAARWFAIARPGGSASGALVATSNLSDLASKPLARANLGVRDMLTANRSYYVSTTGSDSNTGLPTTTAAVTFTNGSANITWTAHGRSVGDNVLLTTTGALPTNFATGVVYYVKTVVDANNITVATSSSGTAVSAGSAGSGTHTANLVSAFLTVQKAIDVVASLDISIFNVTIQAGAGTYTAGVSLVGPWVGTGTVTLLGDAATPTNVIISTTNAGCISLSNGARLTLAGFKLQTTTSGTAVSVTNGANLTISGSMNYGAAATYQISADNNGGVIINSNYTISGGAFYHYNATSGGFISAVSIGTITVSGTPAFGIQFAYASRTGKIQAHLNTYSGSATGTRYLADSNGVIFTNGGGASYFPGNAAGSTATGGQYI